MSKLNRPIVWALLALAFVLFFTLKIVRPNPDASKIVGIIFGAGIFLVFGLMAFAGRSWKRSP